jgi:hypothetical protein
MYCAPVWEYAAKTFIKNLPIFQKWYEVIAMKLPTVTQTEILREQSVTENVRKACQLSYYTLKVSLVITNK